MRRELVVSMREQVRQRNPQAFQEKIEKQTTTQGAVTNRLHKRGCHCKKSHCKKKYCECFQVGRAQPMTAHWQICLHHLVISSGGCHTSARLLHADNAGGRQLWHTLQVR